MSEEKECQRDNKLGAIELRALLGMFESFELTDEIASLGPLLIGIKAIAPLALKAIAELLPDLEASPVVVCPEAVYRELFEARQEFDLQTRRLKEAQEKLPAISVAGAQQKIATYADQIHQRKKAELGDREANCNAERARLREVEEALERRKRDLDSQQGRLREQWGEFARKNDELSSQGAKLKSRAEDLETRSRSVDEKFKQAEDMLAEARRLNAGDQERGALELTEEDVEAFLSMTRDGLYKLLKKSESALA